MAAHRRLVLLGAAWTCGALPAETIAQTRASAHFDIGASRVTYDDFLPSLTAFGSLDARLASSGTTVNLRGSALRFESGRASVQGFVAASQFLPAHGPLRAELSATAGGSRYADLARFAHALARIRAHRVGRDRGGWLGLTLGSTAFGSGWRPVGQYGAGGWTVAGPLRLDVAANWTSVGDTTYTDLETFGRLPWGPLVLEAWLGARLWSRGAGRGVYGEVSVTIPLHERVAIVAAAGRYPTDPIRGTISGRYLSAALRLTALRSPSPPPRSVVAPTAHGTNGSGPAESPRLSIGPVDAGHRLISVEASVARTVEIIGDFTDWQSVSLTLVSRDRWEARLPIGPGLHRVSVRIDGGPWLVPGGVTRVTDEFGGAVGLLTVP